jgi:hypothetical protein
MECCERRELEALRDQFRELMRLERHAEALFDDDAVRRRVGEMISRSARKSRAPC